MTDREAKEKMMEEMIYDLHEFDCPGLILFQNEEMSLADHLIRKGWRKVSAK